MTALDLLNDKGWPSPAPRADQYQKLRMLLEQPDTTMGRIRVRGTVQPSKGIERLTLRRVGIDPLVVSTDVGPNGSVDFLAVDNGVYVVELVPPSFPMDIHIPSILISASRQAPLRISLPSLQPVRIRVSTALENGSNEQQAVPFSLLLAKVSPSDRPRTFHREIALPSTTVAGESITIPDYMVAALSKGATIRLITLSKPTSSDANKGMSKPSGNIDPRALISPIAPFRQETEPPIRLVAPAISAGQSSSEMFFYSPQGRYQLTAAADGSFNISLPEGDYVVAVGLSGSVRAFGGKPGETLRSPNVDLKADIFRVGPSADREILIGLP